MYKPYYSRFFAANPGKLHFTAHSHHPWPDVTRDAQLQYWDDSMQMTDDKWDHIFGSVVPAAQQNVAEVLGLKNPQNITFAPNTHELVARLLSCFETQSQLRVLTTDSEFHSFTRQLRRYEELPGVAVTRVALEPFTSFEERLCQALAGGGFDLVFLSHVFFNSGYALRRPAEIVSAVRSSDTVVVLDGYHAFCALPVSLAELSNRVFYLAGGYKYAQCGEGACFLYSPPGCSLRPVNTGWFASFDTLEAFHASAEVKYGSDAFRFWGATFDPSGLYRLNAALSWMKNSGISVARIHAHVRELQQHFLQLLAGFDHAELCSRNLILPHPDWHAHFLAFRTPYAPQLKKELAAKNISTDCRRDLLRFGFGIYQERSDIEELFRRLT